MAAQTFDQLIDFTRTTAATYVDATGKIAITPASRNLLTFTQEFDNAAWVKANATVTANSTTAPDGTLTADKLVETTTTAEFILTRTPTLSPSTTYTFSCYMKAAERTFGVLNIYTGAASCWTWFNLSTGAVSTLGAGATATITAVGNGWYRCTLTIATAASGTPNVAIFPAATNGVTFYAGTAGNGIFIWGAQLEQASAATTYTRNFGGVFPPRFDYDPVTLAPKGLLIEEQRTNLLTYSEQFDNAAWAKSNATVTANAVTAPDGTSTADKAIQNAVTAFATVGRAATIVVGTSYTFTVYGKMAEWRYMALAPNGSPDVAVFDLQNGVVASKAASTVATVTAVGDGWFRCSMTYTEASLTSRTFAVLPNNTGTFSSQTGDGTSGIFIWGAQLEAGAFATSYIPTVASQVTRTADQTTISAPNFSSWYNQSEGTFVVEASSAQANSNRLIEASGGISARVVDLLLVTTGGAALQMYNGTANLTTLNFFTAGSVVKAAGAYATSDYAAVLGGSAPATNTAALVNSATSLQIGRQSTGAGYLNGHIRSIRYYPSRLTNAQLQALTA